MQACHLKSHNTFTRFYLKDLTGQDQTEASYHLGTFVAAQQVMPPPEQTPGTKKGGAPIREPHRWGVSESSDTIEWTFSPI